MSGLSEEIGKLFALHQQGILSIEEFNEAKKAVIQRFSVASPVAQNAPSVPPTVSPPALSSNNDDEAREIDQALYGGTGGGSSSDGAKVNISAFEEPGSVMGARNTALTHLETILNNLLKYPNDAKYRRLRLFNARLQQELFAEPGSIPFLRSIGFQIVDCPTENEVQDRKSGAVAPSDGVLEFTSPTVDVSLIHEGLRMLHRLRAQDKEFLQRRLEYTQMRRSIGFEVRWERWLQAERSGNGVAFLMELFTRDDAGDGLFTVTENIHTLRRLMVNARGAGATDSRYRTVKLTKRIAFNAIVQQIGGLELLIGVACAQLREAQSQEGSASITFKAVASSHSEDETARPAEKRSREEDDDNSRIILSSNAPPHTEEDLQNCLAEGLAVLEKIEARVAERREEIRVEEREAARQAIMEEMKREKRQDPTLKQQRLQREQEAKASEPEGEKRRVPISEALNYLLGKKDDL